MSRPTSVPASIALTTLLCGAPLSAQSAWTKAPALPRACYAGQDTFSADAEKATTALQSSIEAQEQTNRALLDQVLNTDPAVLNQKMLEAVQKDPAKAQEIMQAVPPISRNSAGSGRRDGSGDGGGGFQTRKKKLMADYDADSKAVLGPSHQQARDYEGRTAQQAEKTGARMYDVLGVPAKDFRPVAEHQGVRDYVKFASELFQMRPSESFKCIQDTRCGVR